MNKSLLWEQLKQPSLDEVLTTNELDDITLTQIELLQGFVSTASIA